MKRVLSAAMALILCLSLIPVAHASYTNPFDKQDNQEVPYSGGLYFGFSESETLNSSVKPQISVSTIEYESDNIPSGLIDVSVSVTGAANQWSASGLHIGYDTRLTLVEVDDEYVEKGPATKKLSLFENFRQTGVLFVSTAASSDVGGDGVMYTLHFRLPSNAKAGDFYPIGIFYTGDSYYRDLFTNVNQNEVGMLMQSYVFFKGITNGGIRIFESNPAPVITSHPQNCTADAGDTASFSVSATNANYYQWQYRTSSTGSWSPVSGSEYSGMATNHLYFKAAYEKNGYQYRCIVYNGTPGSEGTLFTASDPATLTVNDKTPVFTSHPSSRTVNEGDTVTFSVSANNADYYMWQYTTNPSSDYFMAITSNSVDGEEVFSGISTKTLTVKATGAVNGWKFRCLAYHGIPGSQGTQYAASGAATLTVNPSKPTITSQPGSVTTAAGNDATFMVVAKNAESYQWQYQSPGTSTWHDSSMTGAKTATLTVPATTARDGQKYRCAVTNAAGTTFSNVVTLTVTPGIAKVAVTIPAPSVGAKPSYTATLPSGADYYLDTSVSTDWMKNGVSWRDETAEQDITSTTSFVSGHEYRVRIYLLPKSGAEFTSSTTATINGQSVDNLRFLYDEELEVEYIRIDYTFPAVTASKPTITTQPANKTAAVGDSVKFTVAASGTGLTYQWQFKAPGTSTWYDSSMTGSKTKTLTVEATAARNGQQYRCKVTNAAGTTTSSAATLTVVSKPVITTQPVSRTAAAGDTIKFTVAATGGSLTYQWQFKAPGTSTWNDSSMTGAKTASLSVPATTARNGQQYRCKVTNAAGTTTSSAATLTVKETVKPAIVTQPKSATAAAGDSVKFTVAATGGKLTYQWQFKAPGTDTWNNSTMTGAKTNTLTVSATMARSGQQYRCIVKNASGSVTSSAATLTVKETVKPAITTQPKSQTAAAGQTVKFTVEATGGSLTYQWQFKAPGTSTWYNSTMTGAKTATLTVEAKTARNGQQYRCVITNSQGTATSSAAKLTVK